MLFDIYELLKSMILSFGHMAEDVAYGAIAYISVTSNQYHVLSSFAELLVDLGRTYTYTLVLIMVFTLCTVASIITSNAVRLILDKLNFSDTFTRQIGKCTGFLLSVKKALKKFLRL